MTKKVGFALGLVFIIMLISPVFATEFDNILQYNADKREVEFKNWYGLGATLGKAKLITPQINYVIEGKDRRVMVFEVENYGNLYKNGLKGMNIYTKELKKVNKNWYYQYAVSYNVSVDEYNEICEEIGLSSNGTMDYNCYREWGGSHIETRERWENLDTTDLPTGKIKIALVTDVEEGDYYDGIPKIFGRDVDAWAVWTASLSEDLVAWYSLDEKTGTNVEENVSKTYNGTTLNMDNNDWTDGIIRGGANFSASALGEHINLSYELFTGLQNFTVSFWANASSGGDPNERVVGNQFTGGSGDNIIFSRPSENIWQFVAVIGGVPITAQNIDLTITEGLWYHIVGVYNGTSIALYVNGTLVNSTTGYSNSAFTSTRPVYVGGIEDSSEDFAGRIDEIGLWNRTLSDTEISDLYNDHTGISYDPTATVDFLQTNSLNNPANAFDTIREDMNFNVTLETIPTANITNTTLYVWKPDFSLLDTNYTVLTGKANSTNLSMSGLETGNAYEWNYYSCSINDASLHQCNFSSSNFTLNVNPLIEVASSFNPTTTEGSNEQFQINITLNPNRQVSEAKLNYNNTEYLGTLSISGDDVSILRTITIPSIVSDTTKNFFWNITLDDNSNYSTSIQTQTVLAITIDECTNEPDLILNYTLRDETNQSILILSGSFNGTIEVDVDISPKGSTTPLIEFNKTYSNTNPAQVCMNMTSINTSEYRMDVTTRYQAQDRVNEFHHIQNFTLKNSSTVIPVNINLYDLETTESQEFLITFRDDSFALVSDALIDITRKYIGEGVFKSVEVPKTDDDGQTLAHLVLSDVIYTIIVKKEGNVLATYENVLAICQDLSSGQCTINLDQAETSTSPESFTNVDGLIYTLSFNEATKTITSTFTVEDGTTADVRLNATLFDQYTNRTVCSDSLTSSTGTLTCTVPDSFGNATVITELSKDGVTVGRMYATIQRDAYDIFGGTGIFLVIIMFITIPLMFIAHPIAILVGAMIGIVAAIMLNVFEGGSIIGSTSIFLWFVCAVGILIWQISQRRGGKV